MEEANRFEQTSQSSHMRGRSLAFLAIFVPGGGVSQNSHFMAHLWFGRKIRGRCTPYYDCHNSRKGYQSRRFWKDGNRARRNSDLGIYVLDDGKHAYRPLICGPLSPATHARDLS
jgi:hypothetical protein